MYDYNFIGITYLIMKTILLISDLHVGSVFAIFPKGYKTRHQNEIALNPLQNELWELWGQMTEDVRKESYDYVFLLGDLVDGLNKKGAGKDRVINDLNEQQDAAIKLIRPLCKRKEIIGITSSPYHNSVDYEIDRDICKELRGHFLGTVANVRIKNINKVINIVHGSGGSPIYAGTKASKDILLALSAEKLEKIPDADLICRAHHHSYLHLEMQGKHMVWNGCFEGPRLNTYSMANYARWQPDIGVTKIEVSDDEIRVIPFLYPLKHERKNIKVI